MAVNTNPRIEIFVAYEDGDVMRRVDGVWIGRGDGDGDGQTYEATISTADALTIIRGLVNALRETVDGGGVEWEEGGHE